MQIQIDANALGPLWSLDVSRIGASNVAVNGGIARTGLLALFIWLEQVACAMARVRWRMPIK